MVSFQTMQTRALLLSLVFLAVFSPSPLGAQPPDDPGARRSVRAVRLAPGERVTLDGRLDEPFWTRIEPAADFIQVDPLNGLPATEPTEVRIAFSGDTFYMGVTCFDSEPEKWIGYQRRRDEFLPADDRFMWTIDTFLDARTGYFFEMNPSGLMADSLMGVNGDNRQWDGIWNARVAHTEFGWTIEIAIPFRTLNFNPDSDTWGINFQRTVRRKNEDSIWMGWPRNQGLRRMTNAGHVTGIRDVTQGHGLDIKPYGLATTDDHPTGGLDLFYNPTPGLRANLTLNTDFAQTEVDQRQVNLTRFSLFFPEKRDFFLDGAPSFDFASPGGDLIVNPFFSRRIGLSADGTPQPITFGTKLTGQLAGHDVGVLHVRTSDGDPDQPFTSEDFTVARVKRRLLRQSYVGAIYTRRAPTDGSAEASHTAGIDLRLATSTFLGNQNLEGNAWFIHDGRPDVRSGNNAFGANIAYPNDRYEARLTVREVQANFNPSVGFVTRRDYRRYQPQFVFGPRPRNSRIVRRYRMAAGMDVQTALDNSLLSRTVNADLFETQFQSQDSVGVTTSFTREHLDTPFTLRTGVVLPAGSDYAFTRVRLYGSTANRRVLAVNGQYEVGDFYSGTRDQKVMQLTVRARPGYIVYLNGEWNDVQLPGARFSQNVYRVVAETQFTPFAALVNNVQYDNVSRVIGWQSRFRWIIQPGTDLYVVYTHNFLDDPVLNRFATLDKRLATKFLYTYRF
jgi:hypothetical protein